jgi:hypothetical protein
MSMIGAALGCNASPHSSAGARDCFAFVWAIAIVGLKLIVNDCDSDRGYAPDRDNWKEFTSTRKVMEQSIFTAPLFITAFVPPGRRQR